MRCSLSVAARVGLASGLLCAFLISGCAHKPPPVTINLKPTSGKLGWPAITRINKPWTRWWWMGSAVDKDNLEALLSQYNDAGIGGVEICPIYGVFGYEKRYIQYLSPQWMEALSVTTAKAKDLGMGVDMTTGTGWPMGGPDVSPDDASSTVALKRYDVAAGAGLPNLLADLTPGRGGLLSSSRVRCVYAMSEGSDAIDLTEKVKPDGSVDWTAPAAEAGWRVYSVIQRGPAMLVKRPAPGGEGDVLDPFSARAEDDWLVRFDKAFADYKGLMPSAQFHDSYEYVGNWTDDLFDQFQKLRGYDLRTQLPALMGESSPEINARVLCDYRQTMADLHMIYVQHWVQWCHAHGMTAREQAHGAPANLLDLYAEADTPETETFGAAGDMSQLPLNQFASSAAHVTGKQLASSESFTWLGEHFTQTLADIKPVADYLLLSGINHMLYHGMAYSPKDAPWPGWLFYAAIDFNPNGGLWHDLPAFNAYVARCQSILQRGKPSNDILLYFPVYDIWQRPQGQLIPFVITGQWLRGEPFEATALALEKKGFGVDFISDSQLANAQFIDGKLTVGGSTYQALVLPPCKFMPPATAENIIRLARTGATVIVQNALPTDVPGLANLETRQMALSSAFAAISPSDPEGKPRGTGVGAGTVWTGRDIFAELDLAGVQRETMADAGLNFIRRARPTGYDYFIDNRSDNAVEGWVTLATPAASAVLLDPMHPERGGVAAMTHDTSGHPRVYLQLGPWETCFVRTDDQDPLTGSRWRYWQKAGDSLPLDGAWSVHFIEGGPVLPADFQTALLASWTTIGDAQARRFAGTGRYTINFNLTAEQARQRAWLLDLGRVRDSARVNVNGLDVGTVFASPFAIEIPRSAVRAGVNALQIDVTNIAANRIADLDRRGVKWKIFRDINFASKSYGQFNAADWPERDSGLIGPVLLTPVSYMTPAP